MPYDNIYFNEGTLEPDSGDDIVVTGRRMPDWCDEFYVSGGIGGEFIFGFTTDYVFDSCGNLIDADISFNIGLGIEAEIGVAADEDDAVNQSDLADDGFRTLGDGLSGDTDQIEVEGGLGGIYHDDPFDPND